MGYQQPAFPDEHRKGLTDNVFGKVSRVKLYDGRAGLAEQDNPLVATRIVLAENVADLNRRRKTARQRKSEPETKAIKQLRFNLVSVVRIGYGLFG